MVKPTPKMRAAQETRASRFAHGGLGKSLYNDRQRQQKQRLAEVRMVGVADSQAAKSVLEQTSLDEFISAAELGRANFDGVRGNHLTVVDCSANLVSSGPSELSTADQERLAAAMRVQVPIPRRPAWHDEMSPEELATLEGEAFLNWRRGLARIEEKELLVMTPYEKNLDFWRQLWRCVERADLLVQILDARDPEFYRCNDLERYVDEWEGKRTLLLINKADFLTPELRHRWKAHFAAAGVDIVFFSALRELHRQQRLTSEAANGDSAGPTLPPHGPLACDDDSEVLDCTRLMEEIISRLPKPDDAEHSQSEGEDDDAKRGVVGFVGYPNVGKSSVINALFGAKKVSMSRTPGKTKHLQTLELTNGVTLCDCPGLVFPSVVATKAHLVINGTVPLTELREALPPARLVVEKVGLNKLLEKFSLSMSALNEAAVKLGDENAASDQPRAFLAALAMTRQHFLRHRVPDEGWGARKVLKEYVTGEILYCVPPLAFSPPARGKAQASSDEKAGEEVQLIQVAEASVANATSEAKSENPEAEASNSDFSDLEDFLNETRGAREKGNTKRKQRQQNKRMQKSGAALIVDKN